MEGCHDNMGHLGIERTTSLLRDRFCSPSMIEDIELHVKACPCCLRFKTQLEKAELNPIIATRPLELVHSNYLNGPNILVSLRTHIIALGQMPQDLVCIIYFMGYNRCY